MTNETSNRRRPGSVTPPDGPATPEGTARRIGQLRGFFARAGEVCERLERVVREGGFDHRTVAVMEDAATHFEDSDDIGAGTALAIRRLIAQVRKDRS